MSYNKLFTSTMTNDKNITIIELVVNKNKRKSLKNLANKIMYDNGYNRLRERKTDKQVE